jgi:hypothetical protein
MRHALSLAVLAVLAAGCSTPAPVPPPPRPSTTTTTKPLPMPDPALPIPLTGPRPETIGLDDVDKTDPEAPASASLTAKAEQKLRRETLLLARTPGTVTAHCPPDLVGCTSTYNGLTITWATREDDMSPPTTEYTFRPLQTIITATAAYHDIWPDNPAALPVRCVQLPPAFVASTEPGTDTGYRCQRVVYAVGSDEQEWQEVGLYVQEDGYFLWGPTS